MLRLLVDPTDPDPAVIRRAASVVSAGGLVALPTDTLYGLAVNPLDAVAVRRVFVVKGRSAERALPLVAADTDQIASVLGPLPGLALKLAAQFWPGRLTLLLPAPARFAANVSGGTGRLGVRVPDHAVARALCRSCGSLVTATSANISGQPASNDPDAVASSVGAGVDVLLDAGKTPGSQPSTIVDVTGSEVRLVRAGAIPWEQVLACAAK